MGNSSFGFVASGRFAKILLFGFVSVRVIDANPDVAATLRTVPEDLGYRSSADGLSVQDVLRLRPASKPDSASHHPSSINSENVL